MPRRTCKASGLSVLTSVEICGGEEEAFDQEAQALTLRGYRIVDKSLVVDPAASPPVWGWILYRETTHAERRADQRLRGVDIDDGAGFGDP